MRVAAVLPLLLALVLAACGGSEEGGASRDPVESVPTENGVRKAVQAASTPDPRDFPPAGGQSLNELVSEITPGPELVLASSVFTSPGPNRMAFGVIGQDGLPVYGPTAIYVATDPGAPAQGPFVAPADVLLTQPRYRSQQAATTDDPFVAVYGAEVEFEEDGPYSVLAVTKRPEGLTGGTAQIDVVAQEDSPVPAVGEQAPKVETDTLESAAGDVAKIDTRQPPSDMHDESFADVVGSEPVALLFATPQLCQSRVCGPVTDIGLQMQASYGDRMTFIHQEVYVDNDINKGLRDPLKEFNLPTEPWLFVVDASGTITARLEGSFGIAAFESAVQTGL